MRVGKSINLKSAARLELFARQHRSFPSDSEALLWSALKARQLGVSFRRQLPVGGLRRLGFRVVRVSAELVHRDLNAAIALVRAVLQSGCVSDVGLPTSDLYAKAQPE